jgi:hypothetical protein
VQQNASSTTCPGQWRQAGKISVTDIIGNSTGHGVHGREILSLAGCSGTLAKDAAINSALNNQASALSAFHLPTYNYVEQRSNCEHITPDTYVANWDTHPFLRNSLAFCNLTHPPRAESAGCVPATVLAVVLKAQLQASRLHTGHAHRRACGTVAN